jgi:serine/threonine protein kinase
VPIALSPFISEHLLVSGHRYLWEGGIEHNDISVGNLMYDKMNNYAGVLNDFDLANVRGSGGPSGTERMGTMPFMALDLLTKEGWAGKVERLYRHDCESFVWVLLWICSRYDNGAEIKNPPFNEFITSDFYHCYKIKFSCGMTIAETKPTASYQRFWLGARQLNNWFVQQHLNRTLSLEVAPEPTNDEVAETIRNLLEKAGFDVGL